MMAAKMLPQLYQELSGDSNLVIRTEPVRAGGDFNNNTFLATGAMVTEMMRNPYLSPVAVPAGTGNPDEYLVYYLYPDNSHFAKLANSSRLPPDFVKVFQSLFDATPRCSLIPQRSCCNRGPVVLTIRHP